ncbi:hypothetical protein [Sorangium sp. So ce385]|uniref:hypothetical protein n=1 Tax=Sorangium sp. So ce385 TaxID=3133308 RepID=UPI003F5C2F6F
MGSLAGRGAVTSVVAVAVCVWGASTLAACTSYSDDCGEKLACVPDAEPPPDPCAGEPGRAPALDQCGVFVSARGDDRNPGTKRAPVKTLQHAIGLAASGRGKGEAPTRRVYACGGEFEEAVTLPSGVDLWGGRRCEAGEWSYGWSFDGPNHPTTIAPPVGIPLRVIAGAEDVTSTIAGVRVVAADASAVDAKSSIAMILSPGAKAKVVSSEVIAGNGKDGEPGDDAPQERAQDGEEGNDGASACTADFTVGARPAVTACDDGTESIGGYGGDGELDRGRDGAPGQPEPAENPEGNGGLAGSGADSARCTDGATGAQGADGGRAAGAVGARQLTVNGWIGVRGDDGRRGGVGQGGGGGGGSKGRGDMLGCPTGRPQGGAAGGSGGSGGCGGQGGQGGGYGGASIGIVALQGSALMLEATVVTAGRGGRGGVGGTGQPGGIGRPGGYGGQGYDGAWDACHGGFGGDGGHGGDAGGGLGGPSYGVASMAAYVSFAPDAFTTTGSAGDGGPAGHASADDPVGRGAAGQSLPYVQFAAADAGPPR